MLLGREAMNTELKIALFSLTGALLGSAIGAFSTLSATKEKVGSEWDLTRTNSVLEAARKDYKPDGSVEYAAWVCYHSILWDCANQEWSVTNPSRTDLAKLCPPEKPSKDFESCPVRNPVKKGAAKDPINKQ